MSKLLLDFVDLGAVFLELCEEAVNGLAGDPQGADGVNNAVVAGIFELVDVQNGGLAELGHVGQQQHLGVVPT